MRIPNHQSRLFKKFSFSRLLISLKKKALIRIVIDPAWRRQQYNFFRFARLRINANLPKLTQTHFQNGKEVISPTLVTDAANLNFELTKYGSAKNKKRIVLCTVCVGDHYQRRLQPCLDSRRRYCQRHGYDLALLKVWPLQIDRAASWLKIPLIYRLFSEGYEYVFALDADALITNHDLPLEGLFDEMDEVNKSVFIGYENPHNKRHVCLNAGSFLLRANEATQSLLQMIWECPMYRRSGCWEQSALIDLYRRFTNLWKITLVENQRRFNSFLSESEERSEKYHWRPGDFVLHFCAQRGDELDQKIKEYAKYG